MRHTPTKSIVISTKIYVQLFQLNDFNSVKVIQCKIEIDHTVKKCEMFSHTSDVFNGQFSYIADVSREACREMHTYGTFKIAETHRTELQSNQTASRPIVIADHVTITADTPATPTLTRVELEEMLSC